LALSETESGRERIGRGNPVGEAVPYNSFRESVETPPSLREAVVIDSVFSLQEQP
jgi:hypothetical protein